MSLHLRPSAKTLIAYRNDVVPKENLRYEAIARDREQGTRVIKFVECGVHEPCRGMNNTLVKGSLRGRRVRSGERDALVFVSCLPICFTV